MCNSTSLTICLLCVSPVFEAAVNDDGGTIPVTLLMQVQQMFAEAVLIVRGTSAGRTFNVDFIDIVGQFVGVV